MEYISILDFMKRKNFTPEEIQNSWDRSFGGARTKYGAVGSLKPMTEEGIYYTADLWTWEYYWPTEPFLGKQPERIYLKVEPNLQNKSMPMNLLNIHKESESIKSAPEGSDVTTEVPKSNHQPHPVVAGQFNLPTAFDLRSPFIQNTVSSINKISGNQKKPSKVKLPKEKKVLPQGRCAECDSDQHSLANHPNANSTDRYLHSCVRCNTKGHEMNNCPKAPIAFNSKEWRWYPVYCANKALLWDFRDFRELKRYSDGYNLQKYFPWSPNFAKKARYKDEESFSFGKKNRSVHP